MGLPLCCVGWNSDMNTGRAIWFLDRPSLVHRCGTLLNIHLDILSCVPESYSNLISPFVYLGVIAKCRPSLSMMCFPMILIVFMSMRRIVLRCAVDHPDCMSNWIIPFMSILLFLKHLNSSSSFSGGLIFS